MRNIYVLDTSALIYDPTAYKKFFHSDIVVPITVLNELDKLKKFPNEVGKNARVAIRLMDEISELGDISTGILLDNDVFLKIDTQYHDMSNFPGFGDPTYSDNQILVCAYQLKQTDNQDVTLVSNDINLRIKAKSRGLNAQAHEDKDYSINDLYSGIRTIVNKEVGLQLQEHLQINPNNYNINLYPNECVTFIDDQQNTVALGRKVASNKVKLINKIYPWNMAARNNEQSFAIDLIMDKNIDLITLIGKSGTGKSIAALFTSLELVLSRKEYDKLIIYRPIQPVGNDIGFTPGTIQEKLAPWFTAIMDSFELLFSNKNGNDWKKELDMYVRKGRIEMEALTYIRGRSIPNAIILVDESQNISKEDIKTILTRAGENTKIILTGDLEQIDNNMLDATNNGLIHVIDKFKTSELAGHIAFSHGERSRLATKASEIL